MAISTITIATVDYTSYASVAEADSYLAVDPVRGATWALLTADQKGGNLVSATRRLDLLNWVGVKAGAFNTQDNAFPRLQLTYPDGSAVTTTDVPAEVEAATILLAGSIALTATVANVGTSGNNISRLAAGSAEIEYFRATAGKPLQDETAFALIRQWLEGYGLNDSTGAMASGTCETTIFTDTQLGYGLTQGFS